MWNQEDDGAGAADPARSAAVERRRLALRVADGAAAALKSDGYRALCAQAGASKRRRGGGGGRNFVMDKRGKMVKPADGVVGHKTRTYDRVGGGGGLGGGGLPGGHGAGSNHAATRFKAQRLRKDLHQKVAAGKLIRKHEATEKKKMAALLASVGLAGKIPGFPSRAGGAQAAALTGGSRKVAARCPNCTRPLDRQGRCRKCNTPNPSNYGPYGGGGGGLGR